MPKLGFLVIGILIFAKGAQAESSWERLSPEISGQLRLDGVYDLEPSSVKDKTAFQSPGLDLNFGVDPAEDVWVQVGLQGGPSRDATNGKWNLQVQTAYAEFLGLFQRRDSLRYGLIPNPWVEYGEAVWGYRWNCAVCGVMAERYKYVSRSDLGVTYRSPWNYGFWSVGGVNGEGLEQDEKGEGKDWQLSLEFLPFGLSNSRRAAVALTYIRGSYEGVDSEISKKERLLAQIHYLQRWGLSAILEAFWGTDPVDVINKKVADQVDLTDHGGHVAHAQGFSVMLKYGLPDVFTWTPNGRAELFARHDELTPMLSVDSRGLKEDLLGFGFFPRQNLQFSLAWSQVRYELSHSAVVGDSQTVTFSTQIGF